MRGASLSFVFYSSTTDLALPMLPISWTLSGSLYLFGSAEAAYPALPIYGSDKLYADKC